MADRLFRVWVPMALSCLVRHPVRGVAPPTLRRAVREVLLKRPEGKAFLKALAQHPSVAPMLQEDLELVVGKPHQKSRTVAKEERPEADPPLDLVQRLVLEVLGHKKNYALRWEDGYWWVTVTAKRGRGIYQVMKVPDYPEGGTFSGLILVALRG